LRTDENNPEDWLKSASSRLASADRLFAEEGASEAAIELLQESTEVFLKPYLIARGWRIRKIHDLGSLLSEAEKHGPAFGTFADFTDELTDQFWAIDYPGGDLDDSPPDFVALRKQLAKMLVLIQA